mmetsp:Transcript_47637/g.111094  ORF Transcript_47637/g.111094 Transcript_47637/m.111094 type:complete len:283 (+) Transcript_47637:924-1772(+)
MSRAILRLSMFSSPLSSLASLFALVHSVAEVCGTKWMKRRDVAHCRGSNTSQDSASVNQCDPSLHVRMSRDQAPQVDHNRLLLRTLPCRLMKNQRSRECQQLRRSPHHGHRRRKCLAQGLQDDMSLCQRGSTTLRRYQFQVALLEPWPTCLGARSCHRCHPSQWPQQVPLQQHQFRRRLQLCPSCHLCSWRRHHLQRNVEELHKRSGHRQFLAQWARGLAGTMCSHRRAQALGLPLLGLLRPRAWLRRFCCPCHLVCSLHDLHPVNQRRQRSHQTLMLLMSV